VNIVLVGNKCDISARRQVLASEAYVFSLSFPFY
jgi:hypothetical protein